MAAKTLFSRLNETLDLRYNREHGIWLTSGLTLRRLIGFLGLALPWALLLLLWIANGRFGPLDSISHYYYTRIGTVFVVVMGLMAIFLIVYKGRSPLEFYISTVAGIAAFCVILFPTDNIRLGDQASAVTHLYDVPLRVTFHLIAAGIFLLCLAFMSIYLFTDADKKVYDHPHRKQMRNRIYVTCGITMVVAVVCVPLLDYLIPDFYAANRMTFWLETVAVDAFGISWLIKGSTLLRD